MRILKNALILVALLLALPARAGGMAAAADWDYFGLPDLTGEQKTRMDDLRWASVRYNLPRAAAINTLLTESAVMLAGEKPDLAQVQQKMDQVSKLSDEMRRESIQMLAGFRALLKKDQAKVFDALLLSNLDWLFGYLSQGFGSNPMGGGGTGVGGPAGGPGQPGPMQGGTNGPGGMSMQGGPGAGTMPGGGAPGPTAGSAAPCDPAKGNCGSACPIKESPKTPKK